MRGEIRRPPVKPVYADIFRILGSIDLEQGIICKLTDEIFDMLNWNNVSEKYMHNLSNMGLPPLKVKLLHLLMNTGNFRYGPELVATVDALDELITARRLLKKWMYQVRYAYYQYMTKVDKLNTTSGG